MEYFTNGPHADFYAPVIEQPKKLIIPTICLTEVFKKILHSRNDDDALQAVMTMQLGQVYPLTDDIALLAAQLGIKHRLPLADSIIFATAQAHRAVVYTQDKDFSGLEGVKMPRVK